MRNRKPRVTGWSVLDRFTTFGTEAMLQLFARAAELGRFMRRPRICGTARSARLFQSFELGRTVRSCVRTLNAGLTEGFRHFVASMPAPVASGWSGSAGAARTRWNSAAIHGARGLRPFAMPVIRRRSERRSTRCAIVDGRLIRQIICGSTWSRMRSDSHLVLLLRDFCG